VSLENILRSLYAQEINVLLHSLWDGGWIFKLGDPINGFKEERMFEDLSDGIKWLDEKSKEGL